MKPHVYTVTCILIFIETLLIISKKWIQVTYKSTDEWINTLWNIHTRDYNSAIIGEELLVQEGWIRKHHATAVEDTTQKYGVCNSVCINFKKKCKLTERRGTPLNIKTLVI